MKIIEDWKEVWRNHTFLFNFQVCFKFADNLLSDIGEQETADFSFNSTSGACVLSLTGKAILAPKGSAGPTRFLVTLLQFFCSVHYNYILIINNIYLYFNCAAKLFALLSVTYWQGAAIGVFFSTVLL